MLDKTTARMINRSMHSSHYYAMLIVSSVQPDNSLPTQKFS